MTQNKYSNQIGNTIKFGAKKFCGTIWNIAIIVAYGRSLYWIGASLGDAWLAVSFLISSPIFLYLSGILMLPKVRVAEELKEKKKEETQMGLGHLDSTADQ